MGRRTWVKFFCDNWLRGSIREEDIEVRAVFTDLVVLAGDSAFGDDGIIQLANDVGFTDEIISGILKIPLEIWLKAKKRLSDHPDKNENRIKINILSCGFSIAILNWEKYQSDYQRQKPHRNNEFIKIRESIKKRDNYTCLECNKNKNELKVPLCIHHIDNNPQNNNPDNLITLCMSCHSSLLKKAVHSQREKERRIQEEKFKQKVQQGSSIEKEKEKEKENTNKIEYAKYVRLTIEEYNTLISKYGETNTKKFIEKLDNYKGSNGKKYKSDYRAILNWVVEEILGKEKQNKFDAVKERIKKEKEAQNG